jgi:hypothetical protein
MLAKVRYLNAIMYHASCIIDHFDDASFTHRALVEGGVMHDVPLAGVTNFVDTQDVSKHLSLTVKRYHYHVYSYRPIDQ